MPSDEMIGDSPDGTSRPVRRCGGLGVGCGQVDDHPRHEITMGLGDDDPSYHLDCHAQAGCPECAERVQGADGATGAGMLEHLLAAAPGVTDDSREG